MIEPRERVYHVLVLVPDIYSTYGTTIETRSIGNSTTSGSSIYKVVFSWAYTLGIYPGTTPSGFSCTRVGNLDPPSIYPTSKTHRCNNTKMITSKSLPTNTINLMRGTTWESDGQHTSLPAASCAAPTFARPIPCLTKTSPITNQPLAILLQQLCPLTYLTPVPGTSFFCYQVLAFSTRQEWFPPGSTKTPCWPHLGHDKTNETSSLHTYEQKKKTKVNDPLCLLHHTTR